MKAIFSPSMPWRIHRAKTAITANAKLTHITMEPGRRVFAPLPHCTDPCCVVDVDDGAVGPEVTNVVVKVLVTSPIDIVVVVVSVLVAM